ncbi:MAG: RluA family pseudouridine synthase [Treponema sp.]|jgi:23S rRNA pseudouridine1911/1915/1917 synthase|nr:RluA family pseudouridine synthase [Treponema sp.]
MPFLSHTAEDQLINGKRLDRYVSEALRLLSRSQIKARNLKAKINGKDVKLSRSVKPGDFLELVWDDAPPLQLTAQDIPLEIIYEDENCAVINKARGMVVHPGAGNRQGTLANALYFRMLCKNPDSRAFQPITGAQEEIQNGASGMRGYENLRPGIVHRLDKETSGVIICAYNEQSHSFLAQQFKLRKVKKTYIALVAGIPKEKSGRIETYLARDTKERKRFAVCAYGRKAVTYYKTVKSWKNASLVMLRPKTGRTHQLRVHMRFIGHPIIGDSVYGGPVFPDTGLMLHSKNLAITLPGHTEQSNFSSMMPDRFTALIGKLNKKENAYG